MRPQRVPPSQLVLHTRGLVNPANGNGNLEEPEPVVCAIKIRDRIWVRRVPGILFPSRFL